jgi:hypothetical protein
MRVIALGAMVILGWGYIIYRYGPLM